MPPVPMVMTPSVLILDQVLLDTQDLLRATSLAPHSHKRMLTPEEVTTQDTSSLDRPPRLILVTHPLVETP
jgi:hypothetical protein